VLATASRPSCTDADNDPLNKTDPLGLRPGPAFERELTGVAVFDGCPAGQILQVYAPNANGTNWAPLIGGYCREPVGGNSGVNPLRFTLEMAGLFPVIGEPADGILCGWGVVGQDWGNAGFDCAAMIPFAGWGSRAAKWGTRAADAVDTAHDARLLWGSWNDYPKVTQNGREYAQVGDRLYTRHTVDRMQPSGQRYPSGGGALDGRSISPNHIEGVIRTGAKQDVVVDGVQRTIHTSGTVQVVTEANGSIVVTVNPWGAG
jgi:hypothetical protein